ncbi:MAG: HNH endonuclease [Actinomycetota bacterium]|nr:HNH endonuclease [Actinomycetota bacterium]
MLQVLAAFDRQEGWKEDGATSAVPWLVGMLGVSSATASGWVRVARALESLPAIAAAYGAGRLSWDQVAALTSFATPDDDAELAEAATGWTAAHTQAIARRARRLSGDEGRARRAVRCWWDDEQQLHLRGRLPAAEGAVVVRALERLADAMPPDPETGQFESYEARCADALVQLASQRLGADGDPDRASVVVHVEAEVLARGEEGVADLEAGPEVAAETARRLACDARLQVVAEGADGTPLGVGRARRTVPPWLLRLIRRRDGGCRFPTCTSIRWTHAHHLVHWADGGPTDADNVLLLCGRHHRLVHEQGWRIEGSPEGELTFVRPDGTPLATGPPQLRADVRRRLAPPLPPDAA